MICVRYACPYTYVETKLYFDAIGLPIAKIERHSYTPGARYLRGASDVPTAVYFPDPSNPFYRWTSIVNANFVYTFVMPLTTRQLTTVSPKSHIYFTEYFFIDNNNISMPNSHKGDSLALEFDNVLFASGFSGAAQAINCDGVFTNTRQQINQQIAKHPVIVTNTYRRALISISQIVDYA